MNYRIKDDVFCWYHQKPGVAEFTVPDGVKKIADMAFYDCDRLHSVILPEGLELIGRDAFAHCTALEHLHLPGSLQEISDSAFEETPWLTRQTEEFLVLGDGILYRYQGHETDVTIPEGVRQINGDAFLHTLLQAVHLPESLHTIGWEALNDAGLRELTIPKNVRNIRFHAIPFDVPLHFQSDFGTVTLHDCLWEDNTEERRFLQLLHETDPEQQKALFRKLRSSCIKYPLSLRLCEAFPKDSYYKSYLTKNGLAIAEQFLHDDFEQFTSLLRLHVLTDKQIEKLLAESAGQYPEATVLLLDEKNKRQSFQEISDRLKL